MARSPAVPNAVGRKHRAGAFAKCLQHPAQEVERPPGIPGHVNQGRSLAPVCYHAGNRVASRRFEHGSVWILVSSLVPLPSFYGAIAYDRQSGAYGFAYDSPPRAWLRAGARSTSAGARVVRRCSSSRTLRCLRHRSERRAAGSDYTRTTAEDGALAQCRSAGGNCQVQVWTVMDARH